MTDQTTTPTTTGDAPVPLAPAVRGTIVYQLSTAGQVASLLAGGDGRRAQTVADVAIPAALLGLCDISADGAVTLDLSSHWPEARTYDAYPAVIDAPRAPGTYAARRSGVQYHDAPLADPIEAYVAALTAARATLAAHVAEMAERHRVARAAEVARVRERAHAILAGADLSGDTISPKQAEDVAHDLPTRVLVEAAQAAADSRRRAAAVAKAAREQAAAQAKADYLDAWLAAHGSEDQRERHAEGLLPTDELMTAVEDWAFAGLGDTPRYQRIGADDVAALFDDEPEVDVDDITCRAGDADEATPAQWAALKALRARLVADETATVTLRQHRCWWDRRAKSDDPEVVRYGLLVRVRRGPLVLEREFEAPDAH